MSAHEMVIASITVERLDGTVCATFKGEVDRSNTDAFRKQILAEFGESKGRLVLDLNQLAFLDSSALTMVHQLALKVDELVVVAAPGTRAHRLLQIAGLDQVFTTVPSRSEAPAFAGPPDPS